MGMCNSIRRGVLAFGLGVLLLLPASVGRAGPLVSIAFQPGAPVISGNNGTLTYSATSGDFQTSTTSSSVLTYAAPFVLPRGAAILSGSPALTIDVLVDRNGNYVANGTGLVLTGTVVINNATFTGTTSSPLLFGRVIAFGEQQPAGPSPFVFNGLFSIQGGALTQTMAASGGGNVFGGFPIGSLGGFSLEAETTTSGTLGNFTQDFSSSNVKPGPIGVAIAEPAGWTLGLIGMATMGGGTWLRRRVARR